jgi:hypothetical protein
MVAGWLFPDRERCGIAIYSRNYISALQKHCSIKSVNSDQWLGNQRKCSDTLNSCDLIHIQYETSFFSKSNRDFYTAIVRALKKPVVVSLHEVYRQFPGVFPRDQIRGGIVLSTLKKWYYDLRHPIQTAYQKHLSIGFGASVLLVHHQYQKEILEKKVSLDFRINVLPMPVLESATGSSSKNKNEKCTILGTTGFINPEYDYNVLFKTLEQLKDDWLFIWIGGIRIPEHQILLDTINQEIQSRNWSEKFIITGWVSEETQNNLLGSIEIYLALFKNRSSSASLARAIGAHRIIIATDCQIVREMNSASGNNVISVVDTDYRTIAESIISLSASKKSLIERHRAINDYVATFSFDRMSLTLLQLYKSIA